MAPRVELVDSSDSDMSDEEPSNLFLDGEQLLAQSKPETVEEKVKRRNQEAFRQEKMAVKTDKNLGKKAFSKFSPFFNFCCFFSKERDARANFEKCQEFLEHANKFVARDDITAAAFSLRKGLTLLSKVRGDLTEQEKAILVQLKERLCGIRLKVLVLSMLLLFFFYPDSAI